MTQKEMIIDFIKQNGSITTLQAVRRLGCTRLASRIYDLKQDGYEFETETKKSKNRYGKVVTYSEYKFKE